MREVTYTDERGRQWLVQIPDRAPDSDASMGIVVGPPSLESLELPEEFEIRLHNALYARNLFREGDVRRRRPEVVGALMVAFRLTAGRIVELYSSQASKAK